MTEWGILEEGAHKQRYCICISYYTPKRYVAGL